MRASITIIGLFASVFIGCGEPSVKPPTSHMSPVADSRTATPPLNDPCEVEVPKLFQLDILEDRKKQAERDHGLRREFTVDVSPETIATLLPLKDHLKHLQILSYNLSESELHVIAECTQLESLNLSYCQIDDDDLETLRPCLANLKLLWLNYNQVSDKSMALIASIQSLKELGLASSEITNDGAAKLAALSNLTLLQIRSKNLTNNAIASLSVLEKMEMFSVGGDGINDDCLDDLLRFPNLRSAGVKLSKEATRRLRTESPKYGQFDLPEPPKGPPITYYKKECIDGWDFRKLKEKQLAYDAVMSITRGVPIPSDAANIHAAEGEFGPDQRNFLVFTTTHQGADEFSRGITQKSLAELGPFDPHELTRIQGEQQHIDRGFPWKAEHVKNSRFSKLKLSNGSLLIDMDNMIVYLKR